METCVIKSFEKLVKSYVCCYITYFEYRHITNFAKPWQLYNSLASSVYWNAMLSNAQIFFYWLPVKYTILCQLNNRNFTYYCDPQWTKLWYIFNFFYLMPKLVHIVWKMFLTRIPLLCISLLQFFLEKIKKQRRKK